MLGFILKLNKEFGSIDLNINQIIIFFSVFIMSFLSFGSLISTFNQMLLFLIISVLLFFINIKNIKNIKIGFSFFAIIFFVLITLIVNILSMLPDEHRTWVRLFSIYIILFFSILSFFYFKIEDSFICILKVITFFGVIHCIYIFFKIFFISADVYSDLYFFGHIRHYSAFLSICFVSSLILSFHSHGNYTYISAFILFILLNLGGRSSFLSIFLIIFFISVYLFYKKEYFLAKISKIVLIPFLLQIIFINLGLSTAFLDSVGRTTSGNITSGRLLIWKESWNYIKNNYFGYGGDAFVQLDIGMKALGAVFVQAHNAFFQISLEWGIGIFILIFSYLLYISYKVLLNLKDEKIVFMYLMVFNLLIISIFDGVFYYIFEIYFLLLFLALVNARIYFLEKYKNFI